MLVDAVPPIDLPHLVESLKEKSRRSLKEMIEAYQEKLLSQLCGRKRKPNGLYRRAGSERRPKTIITSLSVVRFRALKAKNHSTGETLHADTRRSRMQVHASGESGMSGINQQAELRRG